MKTSQAVRLTYGFDPIAWLAYADWLAEQGEGTKTASDLWRCRGETALAVLRWLDYFFTPLTTEELPVDSREIALPHNCFLRPRLTKKLLFLPLWYRRVSVDLGQEFRAANPDSTAIVSGSIFEAECLETWQLLKANLKKDAYLKRRLIEVADRVLGRP